MSKTTRKRAAKRTRRGVPLTMYFPDEQAKALHEVARQRHVTKVTLVRFAVDELLARLKSGQLQLPLGL